MGYIELIDALRKEGEEKVHTIWKEAETEAQRISEETFKRMENMREEYGNIHSSDIREQTETILSEAGSRARMIRLLAEKELSDRLYRLALCSLHLLRDERYKDIFDALIEELPHYKWKIVRVNSEDKRVAKEYFPDSDVIPDSNIRGGLDIAGRDGMIRIINTLEKRLERAWGEILPGLIKDVRSMIQDAR